MVANRHGKEKSDKETQSPMQKIFRELMEREMRDPEKEGLLRERIEERRRRCNQARMKSIPRSYDSSGSERKTTEKQYNAEMTRRRNEYVGQMVTGNCKGGQCGHMSDVSGKDEKPCTSNSEEAQKKSEDETCSCYSCVLKNYVFSHYVSIVCLVLLFIFTIVIAFLLLMKTTSISACDKDKIDHTIPDSEHFRRRLEAINRKHDGNKDLVDNGVNSYASNRKFWDDSEAGDIAAINYDNSPYGLQDSISNQYLKGSYDVTWDFPRNNNNGNSEREMRKVDQNTDDFNNLLRDSKANMETGNDNMKNFYKKFFQTEALIRNLKKNSAKSSIYRFDNMNRGKRSLKAVHNDKSKRSVKLDRLQKRYVVPNPNTMNHLLLKDSNVTNTNKQSSNDLPGSFLIEKKKFYMEFDKSEPIRKSNIKPKCSHTPKEFKYHEKEMTHPFYKNTQRLDELLDKMLNLKLPDASDPLAIELLLNNDNSQCKHLNTSITTQPTDYIKQKANIGLDESDNIFDIEKTLKTKTNTAENSSNVEDNAVKHDILKNYEPYKMEAFTVSDNIAKEKLQTPSWSLNSAGQRVSYDDYYSNSKIPIHYLGLRKLLQSSDADNYQFDSYIQDEKVDIHNVIENIGKRSLPSTESPESQSIDDINEKLTNKEIRKPNTQPDVSHNPNWKGPMPLYPDEINTIIRQAAMQNVFNAMRIKPNVKNDVPINIKDNPSLIDSDANDVSDTDYIENYLNTRLEKYVKMAQAYSDYGVLEEKKESTQKQLGMAESKNSDDHAGVNLSFIDANHKHEKDRFHYERYKKGLKEDANATGSKSETTSTEISAPLTKSDENIVQLSGNSKTFMSDLEDESDLSLNFGVKENSANDLTTRGPNERDDEPNFIFGGKKRSLLMHDYVSQGITKDKVGDDKSKIQSKAESEIKMKNSGDFQLDNNASVDCSQIDSKIYKSRSLLSVETDKSIQNNDNITLLTNPLHENGSRTYNSTINNIELNTINSTKLGTKNKTVVKRNIRNENLVFWNDLYDDEYGVNVDSFSDDLIKRIKLASKPKEDKARSWFKTKIDKIKKLVHSQKNHSKSYMKPKKPQYTSNYRYRRQSDDFGINNNDGNLQKTPAQPVDQFANFQKLSSKMKDIFKDAAAAINSERSSDSSEPSTDEALSHSLIQQLVKMLNDLIDYQVQQKTCRKLPQDLQSFLAWLTESKDGHVTPSMYSIEEPEDFSAIKYNIQNDGDNPDEANNFDIASERHKSVNALQELMQEYDMLTDEDKIKMPGMKEYIENQMDYIQRNVMTDDRNTNPELDYLSGRFKRDALKNSKAKSKLGQRMKRRLGRFFKTFNKKHTKSTATSFDVMQVSTEMVAKAKGASDKKTGFVGELDHLK